MDYCARIEANHDILCAAGTPGVPSEADIRFTSGMCQEAPFATCDVCPSKFFRGTFIDHRRMERDRCTGSRPQSQIYATGASTVQTTPVGGKAIGVVTLTGLGRIETNSAA
jgi:hypothetical protein